MPKLSEVAGPATAPSRRKLSEVSGARPPALAAANPAEPYDQYMTDVAANPPAADANPSLFNTDSDFQARSNVGGGSMFWAAAKDMFGSREGAAEYLAKEAGGRTDRDFDGEPVVVLPSGERYRLNDPGLDLTDAGSVGGNVAAMWTPASWAARFNQARALSLPARAGVQAGTGMTADVAVQAAVNGGDVEPARVVASGLGGVGGEVIGTGIAKLVSGLQQRITTQSAKDAAITLARDAGVTDLSTAQMNRLAAGMSEIKAGADPRAVLGREEFGFLYTQGQRMAESNPAKFGVLSREEVLRQAPGSADVLRRAGEHNAGKLDEALDTIASRQGVPAAASPSELVAGVAAKVRGQADELDTRIGGAYDAAAEKTRSAVGRDAITALPDRLRGALREIDINPQTTPGAARTLAQVREASQSILADPVGGSVSGVTLRAIETQRRIINNAIGTAANPTDRKALTLLKAEYDRWLDDAVETALVSGDADALALLKNARGLRAEYGRRFEGNADTDKFIGGLLDGTRTPEELLNIALGATQVSKAGGARFIERLRLAANDDPTVMQAMRAANFQRLTRGADGKPLNMGQIVRNIDSAEYSNGSVMRALYTPAQLAEIRRLANALKPLLAKGEFAKSSGTGERLARMLFQRFGGSGLPVVGPIADAVAAGRNYSQAARTLNDPLRVPLRAPTGVVAAGEAGVNEYAR